MTFSGVHRCFTTKNNVQYNLIGDFWNEMAQIYGMENLRGLGCNWSEDSIEYIIGLKNGTISKANFITTLPDNNWIIIKGRIEDLSSIYEQIYSKGPIKYEIEMLYENGEIEIWYYR